MKKHVASSELDICQYIGTLGEIPHTNTNHNSSRHFTKSRYRYTTPRYIQS